MTKQIVIDFADLRHVEITCARCGSRVAFDAKNPKAHAPVGCSGCDVKFNEVAVQNPLRAFIEIYWALTQPDQQLTFRVIVQEAPDKDT